MTESRSGLTEPGWGRAEAVVMAAVLVAMLIPWTLFVTAPPDGLVNPLGIVISLIAGAYLAFVVYSYLKYSPIRSPKAG